MATLIERTVIHGVFRDTKITRAQFDVAAGFKSDRRKSYALINGVAHDVGTYSTSCSGCCEAGEHRRGGGCSECGYTGRRRHVEYFPLASAQQ